MPVRFDTSRIIRADNMDRLRLLRKLNGNFTFSSERIIRATDFVLAASAPYLSVYIPNGVFMPPCFLNHVAGDRLQSLLTPHANGIEAACCATEFG